MNKRQHKKLLKEDDKIIFANVMAMMNKLKSQPDPPESTEWSADLQALAWMDTGDTTWQSLYDNGETLLKYSIKFYGNTHWYPGLCPCMTVEAGEAEIETHALGLIRLGFSVYLQIDDIPSASATVTVKHSGEITIRAEA